VYVKYNQALKARHAFRNVIDPISLQDIDDCNEWLVRTIGVNIEDNIVVEDELVFDGDTNMG
jgi:hypothetical protein